MCKYVSYIEILGKILCVKFQNSRGYSRFIFYTGHSLPEVSYLVAVHTICSIFYEDYFFFGNKINRRIERSERPKAGRLRAKERERDRERVRKRSEERE